MSSRWVLSSRSRLLAPPARLPENAPCRKSRHILARRLPGQAEPVALPQAPRPTSCAGRTQATRPFALSGRGLSDPSGDAIAKLGSIDDPSIGVFVHWNYLRRTPSTASCQGQPAPAGVEFLRDLAGLVALLNTAASLESVGRPASRIWTDTLQLDRRPSIHERLDESCSTGRIRYSTAELKSAGESGPNRCSGQAGRGRHPATPRAGADARRHVHGHDQRLLRPPLAVPDRFQRAQGRPGLAHREVQGGQRSTGSTMPSDSSRTAASSSTGAIPRPKTDPRRHPRAASRLPGGPGIRSLNFRPNASAGSTSSACSIGFYRYLRRGTTQLARRSRRMARRDHQHRGGPGKPRADGADETNPATRRASRSGHVPRCPLGSPTRRPVSLGVLLIPVAACAYAFNHDLAKPRGCRRASGSRPATFPYPAAPSRASVDPDPSHGLARGSTGPAGLVMDVGRGESVALPDKSAKPGGAARPCQWPFMAADLGCSMETIMAH